MTDNSLYQRSLKDPYRTKKKTDVLKSAGIILFWFIALFAASTALGLLVYLAKQ